MTANAGMFEARVAGGFIRECDGDTCGWLFLDTTRNHSRRWCDMRGCGNRAKVRRHRQKQRRGRRQQNL